MVLVTLGVVYGDIGTSPMYTLKAIMSGNGGLATMSEDVVLGALSLLIWTITLITTVKYVLVAMKADNHNEGGIFALYSLVRRCGKWLIIPAMVGGAALLADGILTPRRHRYHRHRGPAHHRLLLRHHRRQPGHRRWHHPRYSLHPLCHAESGHLDNRQGVWPGHDRVVPLPGHHRPSQRGV
jgi:hypothetical protein